MSNRDVLSSQIATSVAQLHTNDRYREARDYMTRYEHGDPTALRWARENRQEFLSLVQEITSTERPVVNLRCELRSID